MIKQEIWVQLESSTDFEELQSYILTLETELMGEIDVVLYGKKEKAPSRLSRIYSLSMKAVPVLMEKLGEQRVKVIERDLIEEDLEAINELRLEPFNDVWEETNYLMKTFDLSRKECIDIIRLSEQREMRLNLEILVGILGDCMNKGGIPICGSINNYNVN